jgi:putative SOS response-associated peptidase YedK
MCGRAALSLAPDTIQKLLRVLQQWKDQGLYRPSFNIGPGATTPVLTRNKSGERELQCMVWGIRLNSTTVINARSETLTEKATFKKLVNNNRCIVVVEG